MRRARRGYVLGVKGSHQFNLWGMSPEIVGKAKDIVASLPLEAWQHLSTGTGVTDERFYDWVYRLLENVDSE